MTMALMNHMSSTDIFVGILTSLIIVGTLCIFYPLLSMSKTRPKVTQNVVSTTEYGDAKGGVLISFVIPAYNEEERLPVMLDATLASIAKYRQKIVALAQTKSETKSTAFEWVIVSDGSTDGTELVVEAYGRKTSGAADVWKMVTLHTNSGKGEAVRTGMLAAQGALRLMVDADGATNFDAILKVLEQKDAPVVFGSRAHLASQAQRSFVRTLLMYSFHFCVDLLVRSSIRDTQCGFKLFTEDAAKILFGSLHLQRWAFDIELVVLAQQLSLDIVEVGVSWHEVEGSKLDSSKVQLALAAIGMLRDMLCVRLCYSFGIWRVDTAPQEKKVL